MKHSNHAQHYTPEAVYTEPHPLAVAVGAAVFAAVMYGITFLAFII